MDTLEKIYCTGHDDNDALIATLMPLKVMVVQLASWQVI